MQGQRNRLVPVEPDAEQEASAATAAPSVVEKGSTWMLMIALRALSERALIALAAIEHLVLAASVFAIWLAVIRTPSELQLVGVGGYALFVLSLIWLRRK